MHSSAANKPKVLHCHLTSENDVCTLPSLIHSQFDKMSVSQRVELKGDKSGAGHGGCTVRLQISQKCGS